MINDHLFLQLLKCSLKARYLSDDIMGINNRPVYRQRNKLHLRDAIAYRFSHVKGTSDQTDKALIETSDWLKTDNVAICGAVVQSGRFLTRIPILQKKGNRLTIVQIHGKLRKKSVDEIVPGSSQENSLTNYLIRASYRAEVIRRSMPDHEIAAEFYFPDKNFISSKGGLYYHKTSGLTKSEHEDNANEFFKLFMKIDVTKSVYHFLKSGLPQKYVQKSFSNISFEQLLDQIEAIDIAQLQPPSNPVEHCEDCEYRKSNGENAGCWTLNFADSSVRHPELHVFDLIGHGNRRESRNGEIFQEDVQIHDGLHSFELMKKFGGPNITIQQRRNLQILKARGEEVPVIWVKPTVESLKAVKFPLHFIDFEAATYALPNHPKGTAYEPVYFQFSCHTMSEHGELTHTEWLDTDKSETDPGFMFIKKLQEIPDIFKGTIMHYSPFEKQAIHNLLRKLNDHTGERSDEIIILEKFKAGEHGRLDDERFIDLSKIIKDGYFNKFMNNGLGLKQLLKSILACEKYIETDKNQIGRADKRKGRNTFFGNLDPYLNEELQNSSITDGSAAMNAWISFKCGLLTESEEEQIPNILKEYCRLDSLSMVAFYNHLIQFDFCYGSDQKKTDYIHF